uniref:U59 n=1 Tax=Human betaherpesvirus 6 TaxID=10368 RepID=A0A1W6DA96_9BETA|nr:U59 [Human betaherpesvirus 6]
MNVPMADEWFDCAIRLDSETIAVHEIFNSDLSKLLNLHSKTVYMSDLCAFISGCVNRNVGKLTIYWHVYGDIIYALTGILHCVKITIECGERIADGRYRLYEVPKLFLMRGQSTPLELKWKHAVGIATTNKPLLTHVLTDVLETSPFTLPDTLLSVQELSIFRERLSYIYYVLGLDVDIVARTEREIFQKCAELARLQQVFLIQGNIMENFVLVQACLFQLGADGLWEEMFGSVRPRPELMSSAFIQHRVMVNNCYCLAVIFNAIYKHKVSLPTVERSHEIVHRVVQEYYKSYVNAPLSVFVCATKVLTLFTEEYNFQSALVFVSQFFQVDVEASRADVIRLFLACLKGD